jgi:hypothetical protein
LRRNPSPSRRNRAGVEDGAKGATATPARNAPTKAATYSIELRAQIEITSRGLRPPGLQRRRDAIDPFIQLVVA